MKHRKTGNMNHRLPSLFIKFCKLNVCGSGETGPPSHRSPHAAFLEHTYKVKHIDQRSGRAGEKTCRVFLYSRSNFFYFKKSRDVKLFISTIK